MNTYYNPFHIFFPKQFTKTFISTIFTKASFMKESSTSFSSDLQGKIMINYFCEASTRTSCSFQAAIQKLGGSCIHINESTSSSKKGETIQDTIKTLSLYGDILVIRSSKKNFFDYITNDIKIPIINAGDGNGHHPTQALLDLYTIYEIYSKNELSIFSNKFNMILQSKKIALIGDLKNSRTIHSLLYLLTHFFNNLQIYLISPPHLNLPIDIKSEMFKNHKIIEFFPLDSISFKQIIKDMDILYLTRLQSERLNQEDLKITNFEIFRINNSLLEKLNKNSIILHPFPRNIELSNDCDKNHRARYFEQMKNGLYIRMALLHELLYND